MILSKYVCDHCGIDVSVPNFQGAEQLGWGRLILSQPIPVTGINRSSPQEAYDCCGSCMAAFQAWMRSKPVNASVAKESANPDLDAGRRLL